MQDKLKPVLSPRGALYLLDEGGTARTTTEWAKLVRDWEASGTPEIVLCLGSSLGFADTVRRRAKGIFESGTSGRFRTSWRASSCSSNFIAPGV